ncbi:putative molybdenum carrier protein [Planctomycetaceae bacterium SH139]
MTSKPNLFCPQRIVSGGQTGVDRGALEAAIAFGLEHGGWCPRGRLSEDGSIPSRYLLRELDSSDYADRTAQNVIDSDATLILYQGKLSGGTLLTQSCARRYAKPYLSLRIDRNFEPTAVVDWLATQRPQTLNVAGPRGSNCPGIEDRVRDLLLEIFRSIDEQSSAS